MQVRAIAVPAPASPPFPPAPAASRSDPPDPADPAMPPVPALPAPPVVPDPSEIPAPASAEPASPMPASRGPASPWAVSWPIATYPINPSSALLGLVRSRDKLGRASEQPVGFMCSRKDPFRYLFFKFALLPRKPEIWCLLDCLTTTYSVRMLFSGMLSLLKCSARTCKLVQRMKMAGRCPSGVVTATWEFGQAVTGAHPGKTSSRPRPLNGRSRQWGGRRAGLAFATLSRA